MVLVTSSPSDMFTTSHEREQKELPKAMRLQERKGKVKKESGTQIKSNLIWDTKFIYSGRCCKYLEHLQTFEPKELAWDKSIPQLVVFYYFYTGW